MMPPAPVPVPTPAFNQGPTAAAPRPRLVHFARQAALPVALLAAFFLPLPDAHTGQILHLPTLCLFRLLTGVPCPGCGLTRSCVCVAHGHFWESIAYHPLGPPTFAVMTVFFLFRLFLFRLPFLRRFVIPPRLAAGLAYAATGLFLAVWLARLAHGLPGLPL